NLRLQDLGGSDPYVVIEGLDVTAPGTSADSTVVSSSTNPSVSGQSVTFTAAVTATASGAGTPTGTVTFKDGATTLGSGTLSGGSATFSTSALAAGTHTITAVYSGDSTFAPSTSSALTQTVTASALPSLHFDFGTTSSPVAAGYTQVANTTTYSAGRGYGWQSGTIQAVDRGTGSDLTRDLDFTPAGTFAADVPNGTYTVTLTMGDLGPYPHDQMQISLEGVVV